MAAKIVYPVKMKLLLLYSDMTQSGVDIFRNVEKSRGGTNLKLTLFKINSHRSAITFEINFFLLPFIILFNLDNLYPSWISYSYIKKS
jgi:hypothetical protein